MSSSSTSRIAKNTLLLYFRQILIMLVSLYTVRVVLNVLGAEDYGIYNVVAGVVTMFGFLSGAMATASQRYFAFDLGKEDYEHLKTTFSVTFQIYILLAAIIVVLAETIGLWFVMNKLVIPPERMTAAIWIYQAAVFSFLLTLITTPYMASIIAHENMNIYAYVSIVEAVLKLAIVFVLQVLDYDKLILYAFLLTTVGIITTAIYRIYCKRNYSECKFQFVQDKALFKELASYSGWNLFGASIGVIKNQFINILLNLYFGVVVNAARAIASQVHHAVTSFSHNFNTALRPPIVKTYAAGDKDETMKLVFRGCKFTYFLMYVFALPLILEMDTVLNLWLETPPDYAVIFTSLALVDAVIDSISYPLMALAQATGKIRFYQSVVGGILMLNFPIAWIALKLGAPAYSVMIVAIIITFAAAVVRLFIIKRLAQFSIKQFLIKSALPCIMVSILSVILPLIIVINLEENFLRLCITTCVSVISMGVCVLWVGMSKVEREMVYVKATEKLPFLKK
ncbi:MAG: oligosaccharide flippase family protein [Bacteroidales bacterium]|nr:oligosaccharide flippase family protein [Bacteroidales bacterium]